MTIIKSVTYGTNSSAFGKPKKIRDEMKQLEFVDKRLNNPKQTNQVKVK